MPGPSPSKAPRPVHLRWEYVGLVMLGGSIGTAGRYLLSTALPAWQGVPVGTFVVNIVGAFALGLLLEALVRRGPDHGVRRILRLLVGTGMLGGFTTYSSLAVETDGLITGAQLWPAFAYGALTLIVGALASTAGIVAGAAGHGWRPTRAAFLAKRHGGSR
ncbi:fluoride efflux transporter FluC [Cryobacterium tepidiphilum]|uniref:Fluoride-specific ion channel FluC n=1 Tax=Cryobacterium tepidiphilum TaxID=2486026 RepID=A0A3M8LA54_9MICO|nr:CrcB family protein [Cryobacterium tepidiphilum]RNE62387.1 CrcB family protein [Cryobacterium tepidiphilum]